MSFESLKSFRHCPGMKEVIGKTRFGNDIWIDFEPDEFGIGRLQVVDFNSEAERYDTLCVLDVYNTRLLTEGIRNPKPHTVKLIENIITWFEGRSSLFLGAEAVAIGHRVSTDRQRYGLSLIHPAYRW